MYKKGVELVGAPPLLHLLRHDVSGSYSAQTALHRDVLWIRRTAQLTTILSTATIREGSQEGSRRGDEDSTRR